MMATSRTASFAMTFTLSCAVIYAVATELNLPVVTYHPAIGEVDFLWTPERRGPAMYWYGWMLTAFFGAAMLASIATVTPERWLQCAVMFGALAAVGYLLLYSLALFVYENATVELAFLKSRWLSVAAALALAGVVSFFLPATWSQRLWPGWVSLVPLGALAVLCYYLTPYFTR
jgi:hypothetical protein